MNLEDLGALSLLSDSLKRDIDAHCVKTYDDGHRGHLGASVIGKACSRALWYGFRWASHATFSGQQYRLFQRGHFEEQRFVEYLEGIGCEVEVFAPNTDHIKNKGKRQIRISACEGHFAGSVDCIIQLPKAYGIEQKVLGEFKTQGCQKFPKLVEEGCQINKGVHFAQQSIYGYKLGLQYSVYMVVNKNTDDLHIELIKLDWDLGKELEEKAERIIYSQEPLPRIAMSSSYYECKYCDYKDVCWFDKSFDKNCRSCVRSKPIADANWECEKFGVIPKEFIKSGCGEWITLV